jgi:hypothetical protein
LTGRFEQEWRLTQWHDYFKTTLRRFTAGHDRIKHWVTAQSHLTEIPQGAESTLWQRKYGSMSSQESLD